jgi:multidrug efflux pump subunit AcrA (membrane-fusion protein)
MSVSVNMGGSDEERILLTERAIGTDQDRKFVFTVNGDKVAKYREVKIGESIKGRRVILSGLETGEKVISEGLALIRPGMPVTPKMPQSSEGATQ